MARDAASCWEPTRRVVAVFVVEDAESWISSLWLSVSAAARALEERKVPAVVVVVAAVVVGVFRAAEDVRDSEQWARIDSSGGEVRRITLRWLRQC